MHRPELVSPVLYSGSLLNLDVLMGALAAALLSREFAIRGAPLGELVKGGVGGLLMGLGANLLGNTRQAVFLLFGGAFGILFQRSRFCLVRAFHEPFLTGEAEHTRAAALALILTMIGFAILKAMALKDATDWVFPGFWTGGLVGGLLFGIAVVLADGCGASSIWRGQVKDT